jgi:PAS domain S-box-containing protein
MGSAWTGGGAGRIKKLLSILVRRPRATRWTMSQTAFEQTAIQLSYLRDPRIAALALDRRPVWLWAVDGTRILWANAAGAASFGMRGPLALATRRFDKGMPIATHVARLAASLTLESAPRLERLRGLGTALGVPCTCTCSLIELETGPALLLVASKRSRPGLSVAERAARLIDGLTAPVALFSSQGQLLHAAAAARDALTAPTTLAFLGAESLAADAWRSGRAAGPSKAGALSIARLGAGPDAALLATIGMIPLALHETYPSHAVPPAPAAALPDDAAGDEALAVPPDDATQPAAATDAPNTASSTATLTERRHPVRFVWEMDEAGHFDIHSEEFTALLGPATAALLGRVWPEIRGALTLDPENRVARAVATRDTWSAITLAWPIDGTHDRIAVELSGLPVFNRERRFSGYRGFGVCRDLFDDEQDTTAAQSDDMFKQAGNETLVFPLARSTENVVPFRTAAGDRAASLSPVEKSAFHELARELALRLQNGMQPGEAVPDGATQDDASQKTDAADRRDRGNDPADTAHADADPTPTNATAAAGVPATDETIVAADEADAAASEAPHEAGDDAATALAAFTTQYDALTHGVLIYTPDHALYANPAFLTWSGYDTLDALDADGGPSAFAVDGRSDVSSGQIITLSAIHGPDRAPIPAQLTAIAWPLAASDEPARESDTQSGKTPSEEASGEDVWVDAPWDDKAWNDQDLNDNSWKDGAWDEAVRADAVRNEATACMITLLGGMREPAPRAEEAAHEAEAQSHTEKAEPHTAPAGPSLPNFALPPEGWQDDAATTNDSDDDTVAHIAADAAAERERSELALSQATTQTAGLRTILEAAADGVLTFDEGGTVLTATAGAQSLFAVTEDDLVGESFDAMLTPESRAVARAAFDALMRGSVGKAATHGATLRSHPDKEVTGKTRFGATLPLLLTLAPVTEAPRRFCAIFRDISTWKAVEQELVAARRQAESASAAKSDFLAKMSHEVRTPLNAIIGFSEVMLSERFGAVDNERYRSYLQDIQASGNHVVSLLNDLLDLSKIEQGKLELAFTNIDLNSLTQDCVGIMQAQAAKERIILRVSLANGLPSIIADATSVKQIILNLLSNAIKFTSAGGQIIVSTALSDTNSVALRIRDTGVGMSEKDVAVALEPFRQLSTAPRPSQKGSGLGLPLTKALAEANRAGFTIKSAINVGTLVEIAFNPARAAAE